MKRKLNEDDAPTGVDSGAQVSEHATFSALGLDPRLLQAIAKENFSKPTPVQSKVIPLALEGKDILARSKTGSGKTAAYVLPILQSLLQKKTGNDSSKDIYALILVPTRELAQQVTKVVSTFSSSCSKSIRTVNLTLKVPEAVQRTLLAESPDIVVTTPARAAQNIQNSALFLQKLGYLVIDEADLVLSYGYEDDLKTISEALPKGIQTLLLSATLSTEVDNLKRLFCRDSVVLDFKETADDAGGVSQFVVKCAEDEKFLLVYVIFKLKLIKGKCIIFVGDTDRCYRLKLFFEQFGIKSCVLNSELPVNTRTHVVEEFNKNVYDIIIASDEHEVLDVRDRSSSRAAVSIEDDDTLQENLETAVAASQNANHTSSINTAGGIEAQRNSDAEVKPMSEVKNQGKNRKRAKEYGVSRGIDFHNVSCVLNFDLPMTSRSYTHRIGRTARAGKTGMALSFVVPAELYHKHKSVTVPSTEHDEKVLQQIIKHQEKKGKEIKPYHFDMKQVGVFRYRMNDALRAVTRIAIQDARARELKQELLKSEKLKRHFEENPEDLYHLRHDGELRTVRIQPHLKHVPDYLLPSNGKKGIAGEDIGFVGLRKTTDNRIRKARMQHRLQGKGRKPAGRKTDPLKNFNAKGRRS